MLFIPLIQLDRIKKIFDTLDLRKGRFRAPLRIVISLLIWTYSIEELLNIFDHITKK